MSWILQFIAPIVFKLLQAWFEHSAKKKEFQESYYAFLEAVDKSGAVKVANHLSATKALEDEQKRLEDELNQQKEEANKNGV